MAIHKKETEHRRENLFSSSKALLIVSIILLTLSSLNFLNVTTAALTDEDKAKPSSIKTGTVAIAINRDNEVAIDITNMVPGESFFEKYSVKNRGTLSMIYAVRSVLTVNESDLADYIEVSVKKDVENCGSENSWLNTGSPVVEGKTLSNANLVGYARNLTIAPDDKDELCFKIALTLNAPNTLQNKKTIGNLVFVGKQADNP